MSASDELAVGISAEENVVVTREMTIGHFVAGMPYVYATPMMILHMEMAAGEAHRLCVAVRICQRWNGD